MIDKTITERQPFWMDHPNATQSANSSLVKQAKVNDLKVEGLHQCKTTLIQAWILIFF